jgi:hypothetical protein
MSSPLAYNPGFAVVPAALPAVELVDGEPVLFRATLSPRWKSWRCTTVTLATLPGGAMFFLCGVWYCLFGGSCREAELKSHDLVLTPTALHLKQSMFECGCCCRTTTKKTVPLEKITDVAIVADCCGDCCGWAEASGRPYQLHIQTAGNSGAEGRPEMSIYCVIDPEGLRTRILDAKRQLTGGMAAAAAQQQMLMAGTAGLSGAGKDAMTTMMMVGGPGSGSGGAYAQHPAAAAMMPPAVAVFGSDTRQAVAVLERIEGALTEAIGLMRAREAREAAGGGR